MSPIVMRVTDSVLRARLPRFVMVAWAGWVGLALAGCGAAGTPPANNNPATDEIRRVDAARLPIGEPMPVLDEGRLVLSGPRDWYRSPQSRKYLVEFYLDKNRQVRVPRIWVTVEESPYDGLTDVDESNVSEFARLVAQRLEADGTELVEQVLPMLIGRTACARYVRQTKFSSTERGKTTSITAERQILEVLAGGRLYVVDLHVPIRKMLAYRDAGYAVVASMEFLPQVPADAPAEGGATEPAQPEPSPPGGDQPAAGP
ncbi:MAG: hypothetical protein J5I93_21485 [Pirellulaceae bacterium]|nr:hypothetical protein [Pirellulaceae bacterium]